MAAVVFYVVGVFSLGGSAFFLWSALSGRIYTGDLFVALSLIHAQDMALAIASTLAIIAIVSFAAGAILEALRRPVSD